MGVQAKAKYEEIKAAVAASATEKADAETREATLKAAIEAKTRLDASETAVPADAASLIKSLHGIMTDKNLLEAAKMSLSRTPGDRGAFDKSVAEQFQTALVDALAAQTQAIQALTTDAETRNRAIAEAQIAVDCAKETQDTSELAASNAQCAKNEAEQLPQKTSWPSIELMCSMSSLFCVTH